ncbi:TRAP transporter permease [Mumia zhuanghuii]|uniref:TRAP transporter fused permease subunit n=1 Tax=Mumia zhuanghuii TaxID=2585211 RepID=A0A5C4MLF7_9ACTN|nr:TRAP transporter fused permease subunit [Mumia zhuanghuii]TNC46579.1 TRAP transporter fused permease subunit [Mumia zhuanghuii]TNC46639.1 TRAP transporter fused permease subunit [Mumia zhuanghuii]
MPTAERDTPVGQADLDHLASEYDEERPSRRLSRGWERVITLWCFVVAVFVLRQVFFPLREGNQFYLVVFLGVTLPLAFLLYRGRARRRTDGGDDPGPVDWLLALVALVVGLYPVLPLPGWGDGGGGFSAFLDRQGALGTVDVVAGVLLLLLVLEATRRTTGWVLPIVCALFLAYAYYGGFLPISWAISHRGEDIDQIVNALYNEASGFFGVPLDVAATYIVLFTIYGAVLDRMGAGRFFVEFSFSLFRKSGTAPGRTVATSGFLLGTVSGSGTATAVTLGSFAWPILKRAGYPREAAGGMLAASGIGAILSPPTLGAAAFIIAEYLGVSYLQVLGWALVPTLLYYLGIFLAVEIDARRFGARRVDVDVGSPWALLGRFGYHFVSLGVIVVFLALDVPPFKAVVYATAVAAVFGLLEALLSRRRFVGGIDERPQDAERLPLGESLRDYVSRLYVALATGIRGAVPVIAVCAAAGVITSTIAKTGLGQVLSSLLVDAADALAPNHATLVVLSALFSAIAIVVLGLAVPVTASFILSWIIIGPALISLGAEGPEVAMFIFYYAVLSEVSPPTALAAVASAAITGGKVMATMWQACKYTLPAFLAPMAFIMTENGTHLLGRGALIDVVWTTVVAGLAVAALAVATSGWMFGPTRRPERLLCVPAALLLLYLVPVSIAIGLALFAAAVLLHLVGRRHHPSAPSPSSTPITQE